ncbi:RNA 2',3'-cyclic phosphodiesterase [Actinomadura parmotrematis]|uniref:RNA 2',3'-cyclic phosphodiesterase n=1 Tax=Actinomadura parmotrematis TaxID=2864039 RepID=A0ABS7FZ46_9ACTN|nr:RNA 2',3'-cyclic phosphodiesterase [Actinomadura parmotrematis]MBW8485721.1 RNA 2',3'-cyclic phosphodiesterase [Actinomadura parmotrematis]
MRLFVALTPPPDVLDALDAFVAPHQGDWPDLRWVRRDLMHVTLAFLGEVDDAGLERLLPCLQEAAAGSTGLRLSLAGAGAFPANGTHARVLWTGLFGDRRGLARLAAATAAAGRRAGTPPDGRYRTFRPHLTLARSRRPVDVRPLLEPLAAFAGTPWTAGTVHLMRSHLPTRERPALEYEELRSWPLPQSPDAQGPDAQGPDAQGPDAQSSGGGGAGRSASGGPQGSP